MPERPPREETPPPPRPAARLVHPAIRCGECHGDKEQEWRLSAHAAAARTPAYTAMKAQAGAGADCARCHEPLAGVRWSDDLVAAEGVTCDVCHTIRHVEPVRAGAAFRMTAAGRTRFGPLCDGEDNYFHRLGCSPLHAESRFCGGCHLWYTTVGGTELPVYTEYEEWQASELGRSGMPCQFCHMAGGPGSVAVGWDARDRVSHHGFLGSDRRLRERALAVHLDLALEGEALVVQARLRNNGAAHHLPSGQPERRVLLTLRVLAASGSEVASRVRSYGRVLITDDGAEALFFRATRVGDDSRIASGEERVEELRAPFPDGGRIEVKIVWRALSESAARALGVEEVETHVIRDRQIPLPPREELPATIEVER
jgi:hypothetical protein